MLRRPPPSRMSANLFSKEANECAVRAREARSLAGDRKQAPSHRARHNTAAVGASRKGPQPSRKAQHRRWRVAQGATLARGLATRGCHLPRCHPSADLRDQVPRPVLVISICVVLLPGGADEVLLRRLRLRRLLLVRRLLRRLRSILHRLLVLFFLFFCSIFPQIVPSYGRWYVKMSAPPAPLARGSTSAPRYRLPSPTRPAPQIYTYCYLVKRGCVFCEVV